MNTRLFWQARTMTLALVDTDILSFFLRGDSNVVTAFERYLAEHEGINISIITSG